MPLFSELKRRNVFRIGIAYLIVAWIVMQVAALAVPALRLPEWVTTFVVFILLLGFPIALVLAWAYELTPDGIRKTRDVPLEQSVRKLNRQRLNHLVITLLSVAVVVLLAERFLLSTDTDVRQHAETSSQSIAVLPFTNMSDDPAQEHFADGLTEELLNSLAAIGELRVISRTSSFTFRDKNLPLTEIAGQLGVEHILEGSVRRAGDRIRVTAQLIDTSADAHLWSETYDRELTVDNIFDIQEDVATTVVSALVGRLMPDRGIIDRSAPGSIEALDRYNDGMYIIRRLELGDFEESEVEQFLLTASAAFEAAIAADPDWAPPYAGIGRLYHFLKDLGDPADMLRTSRQYLDKAVELDPSYGPSHASLGYVNTMEGRFEAALAAYDEARELGFPSHWGRAILLRRMGRFTDSAAEYRKATEQDPMSMAIKRQLLGALYCTDEMPELAARATAILQAEPDDRFVKSHLAYSLVRNGDVSAGLRLADGLAAEVGTDLVVLATLAHAGEVDRVRAAIDESAGNDNEGFEINIAIAQVILGDVDPAIERLEQLTKSRPGALEWFICSPEFRVLEGHPRYDALVERAGIP